MRCQTSRMEYAKRHRLDVALIERRCAVFGVLPCLFHDDGIFDFDGDGKDEDSREAAFLACGEDFVAWPLDEPQSFALFEGFAGLLGYENVTDATTWSYGASLMLHKTPLEWCQGHCRGAVILEERFGPVLLRDALGPIECANDNDALWLDSLMNPPPFNQIIVAMEHAL